LLSDLAVGDELETPVLETPVLETQKSKIGKLIPAL